MKKKISKKIKREFASRLVRRNFLGKEYIVYIFSLSSSKKASNFYLNLEASETTRNFDETKGYPIPRRTGQRLKVSFKNYQRYSYERGSNIRPFKSIVSDHKDNGGEPFIEPEQLEYWQDKHVYFCGYEFEEVTLVIFLIFDFDPDVSNNNLFDTFAEKELPDLLVDPVLKNVEDTHHKQYIFNEKYLGVLKQNIDQTDFSLIHEWIRNLSRNYSYSHYLQKIYYDFLIKNLWMYESQLVPLQQEKLSLLIKEFEKKQKNLFIIPNYRDHFLHPFNVYLLGITIISTVNRKFKNNIIDDFNHAYRPAGSRKYENIKDTSVIWFLASMLHDISYPVEKSGHWLDAFSRDYLYPPKYGLPYLEAKINIPNIIPDIDYSGCIDDLAEYHRKLHFENGEIDYEGIAKEQSVNKGCEIRNQILYQIIKYRDHGILSATMLLHRFRNEKEVFRFLFPAAAAISIHNFLWIDRDILKDKDPCTNCTDKECAKCAKWKTFYSEFFEKWKNRIPNTRRGGKVENLRYISYERDPVGFLLILCDLLQDWGRHDFERLEQAFDLFFNPCKLVKIDVNKNKIVFFIEIKEPSDPDTAEKIRNFLRYKKQEIVKMFSRLRFIEGHDIIIRLFSKTMHPIKFSMNYFSR